MIFLYYTYFQNELSEDTFYYYLSSLPHELRVNVMKFQRWQNRHSSLFGKLLLQEAIKDFSFQPELIMSFKIDFHKRPFIENFFDFNITHSENYVILALSDHGRVGVDVEKINDIVIEDFDGIFSKAEISEILQSKNNKSDFFNLWTLKESVIKADGRGVEIPLNEIIIIDDERVNCQDKSWYYKRLEIHPDYCCCLASDAKISLVKLKEINFS